MSKKNIISTNTHFDDKPFEEVFQLFLKKQRAVKAKDLRTLTKLANEYPDLFQETSWKKIEATCLLAQQHNFNTALKEALEKNDLHMLTYLAEVRPQWFKHKVAKKGTIKNDDSSDSST